VTAVEQTSAAAEGAVWSGAAAGWVEHWAGFAAPARQAAPDAAGIEPGMSLLDVACGSGEFLALAAARGARVSGIDAAAGLVEHARRRVPDADIRVGAIEQLPWPDRTFDVVTGFNAFQFAADFVVALAEDRRVRTWVRDVLRWFAAALRDGRSGGRALPDGGRPLGRSSDCAVPADTTMLDEPA
jgi:SAM-dependent methyltransferase